MIAGFRGLLQLLGIFLDSVGFVPDVPGCLDMYDTPLSTLTMYDTPLATLTMLDTVCE